MNATTKKLHDLGQSLWRDNITREMLGNGALARYISELSVTGLTSNPTIFEHAIGGSGFHGESIGKLLRLRERYLAAAGAYLCGIERRIAAGLDPKVESVASLFVSRWDVSVKENISAEYYNRLGIAITIAMRTYKAYRELLASTRWQRLAGPGAHPQRLLWASTGTKDPAAPDTLYVEALAAPGTIDTVPERTLLAFADHGRVGPAMPVDGGYAEAVLEKFRREGVDDEALAAQLQREGAGGLFDLVVRTDVAAARKMHADRPLSAEQAE